MLTALRRVSAVVVVALACSPAPTDAAAGGSPAPAAEAPALKHPALDEKAAAESLKALGLVTPDQRPVLAVNGLVELERGRVGRKVLDALDAYVNAPLDMRSMKIASGLDSFDAREGWKQACKTSFDDVMRKIGPLSSSDRWTLIRGACDAARFEQLGVAAGAKVDSMAVTLALVALGSIERGATVSEAERALLAAIAATPDPDAGPAAAAP